MKELKLVASCGEALSCLMGTQPERQTAHYFLPRDGSPE